MTILHITPRQVWEQARAEGSYRGETLETEGFIHASTPAQVLGSANAFFRGRSGLLVLKIETNRVLAPIRWESLPGSTERFPHIYGPLNLDAVVDVQTLEPGASGASERIGPG